MSDDITKRMEEGAADIAVETGKSFLNSMVGFGMSLLSPLLLIATPLLFTSMGRGFLEQVLPAEWYEKAMQFADSLVAGAGTNSMLSWLTPVFKFLGLPVDEIMHDAAFSLDADGRAAAILDKTGSDELAAAVKADPKLWETIINLRTDNGTRMEGLSEPIDAEFITKLLNSEYIQTQHPELLGKIVAEMSTKTAPADGKIPEGVAAMQTAVQGLVNDPASMKALKDNPLLGDIIEASSPIKFTGKALSSFIRTQAYDADGNARPEFTEALSAMLSAQPGALQGAALFKMLQSSAVQPAALAELFRQIDTSKLDATSKGILPLLADEAAAKAFQNFSRSVGPDKAAALFAQLTNEDPKKASSLAIQYLTAPGNEKAAAESVTFLQSLDATKLPANMQSLVSYLPLLNNPVARTSLHELAKADVLVPLTDAFKLAADGKPVLDYATFVKVVQENKDKFSSDISTHVGNLLGQYATMDGPVTDPLMKSFLQVKDNRFPLIESGIALASGLDPATPIETTSRVVNGLMNIAKEGKMTGVTPEDFRTFFSSETNQKALNGFLSNLDASVFPPENKEMVLVLKAYGPSVTEVLKDPEGAAFITTILSDPKAVMTEAAKAAFASVEGAKNLTLLTDATKTPEVRQQAMESIVKLYLTNEAVPQSVKDHQDELLKLMEPVLNKYSETPIDLTAGMADKAKGALDGFKSMLDGWITGSAAPADTSNQHASIEADPGIAALVAKAGITLPNGISVKDVATASAALVTGRNDSVPGLSASA